MTQAATIANDMMMDARNFSARLNDSGHIELEMVRYFLAKFTATNVQMHQVIQMGKDEPKRRKRNIFGSILSSLTGLVTEEGRLCGEYVRYLN